MFSINNMLKLESVKRRLDRQHHLSFLEFNYMLLQAYDFAELNKRYSCRIQFGGSEQWSNIINGVELGRRMGLNEMYGVTTNLILTSDGKKMGKTVSGAVWLKKDMLGVYDYWQFWRNVKDEDVFKFLKLFTDLNIVDIDKLKNHDINELKELLADEATKICHGIKEAEEVKEKAKNIFSNNISEMESIKVSKDSLDMPLYKLIAECIARDLTKNQVKRLIIQNAVRLDDEVLSDPMELAKNVMFQEQNILKLSIGKKQHYKLIL